MNSSPSHSFSQNAFLNNGYSFNILSKFHGCDRKLEGEKKKKKQFLRTYQEPFIDYTNGKVSPPKSSNSLLFLAKCAKHGI